MDRIRPSSQQSSNQRPANNNSGSSSAQSSLASKLMVVGLVLVGVAIAAALSIVAFADNNPGIKQDQYQAVFLDNGQVYFGHLDNVDSQYATLTDIYYLQVSQDGIQEGENNAQADPQISLAKLGNELHGPEDVMYISVEKILFWENLKDDGDVVQAITNQSEGTDNNAQAQPNTNTNVETNSGQNADQ